jgi:hypothetical protein
MIFNRTNHSSLANVLVNWTDLQRGDLIRWRGRKHLVIGFNMGATLVWNNVTHVIYCYRMWFGKWRVGGLKKILVTGGEEKWFEVIN